MTLSEFMRSREAINFGVIIARDNSARPHLSRSPAYRSQSAFQAGVRSARNVFRTSSRDIPPMVLSYRSVISPDEHCNLPSVAGYANRDDHSQGSDASTHSGLCQALESADPDPRSRIMALYDEFRPRLFRYMRSLHLAHDQADEVIQETFVRLTAELLKKSKIDNVPGWIVRVAHNLAIDLLKREQGSNVASDNAEFIIGNRVDPSLNPEDAYAKKEQSRRMTTALFTFDPKHRQCFQMRAQGLRYRDIGLALGISEQRAAFVVKQVAIRLAAICG
jgi:RNA polymerase sigma-70 factor, ECF subfamily